MVKQYWSGLIKNFRVVTIAQRMWVPYVQWWTNILFKKNIFFSFVCKEFSICSVHKNCKISPTTSRYVIHLICDDKLSWRTKANISDVSGFSNRCLPEVIFYSWIVIRPKNTKYKMVKYTFSRRLQHYYYFYYKWTPWTQNSLNFCIRKKSNHMSPTLFLQASSYSWNLESLKKASMLRIIHLFLL